MVETVLVTGGAGFIGSHVCKALAAAGFRPVAVDNLSMGHHDAVRWGPLERADIADTVALGRIIATHRPVAAIHLAAHAYVGESVAEPQKYYLNNVAGTLSLLNALLSARIRHFVFSSTCATYGNPVSALIDESHPQNPINPYGQSKLMVETILRDYARRYDLAAVMLRYFNAAGADPDGELGENHDPETHAIPLVIKAALGQAGVFSVYGDDYPTPDGTAVRDYIHVSDLADAHVRALGYLLRGGATVALNLGTGRGHSLREIIAATEKVTGRPVPHRMAPRREGDPASLVASPALARDVLGWEARHSELDTMIQHAARWFAGQGARLSFESAPSIGSSGSTGSILALRRS